RDRGVPGEELPSKLPRLRRGEVHFPVRSKHQVAGHVGSSEFRVQSAECWLFVALCTLHSELCTLRRHPAPPRPAAPSPPGTPGLPHRRWTGGSSSPPPPLSRLRRPSLRLRRW